MVDPARGAQRRFDVLGLGCAAIDDFLYVAAFPPPNSKARVLRKERQCGGLTATALAAAARLGSSCAYAGVLGDDELSRFVLDNFAAHGVETSTAFIRPGARPIHATIIVEPAGARTIYYSLEGVSGASESHPSEEVIRSSRVLLVDHFGAEGMIRAAAIARAGGIPVVADFESDESPRFGELLDLVDHLILSEEFAARFTGAGDPPAAAQKLWNNRRRAVVITCGERGCWHLSESSGPPRLLPAFRVDAVDTTGCGDVFHGAYASALSRGLGFEDRLRFASAAAALKATRPGGQKGIPERAQVESFLKA